MNAFLVEEGILHESFASGVEALERIGDGDVVITSMILSDMNGEEFIKRIIGATDNTKIIVLTSNDSPEQQQRLKALGVKATVIKSASWKRELRPLLVQFVDD